MAKPRVRLNLVVAAISLLATLVIGAPLSATAAVTPCVCTIKLSPIAGHAGTYVTVKGSHYVARGRVRIQFVGPRGTRTLLAKNVVVATNGTFSVRVRVPGWTALGVSTFSAGEKANGLHAKATFKVI